MDLYVIDPGKWETFLDQLSMELALYLPDSSGNSFTKYQEAPSNSYFTPSRIGDPPKEFFLTPKTKVASFDQSAKLGKKTGTDFGICGLKSCDLLALARLDQIFLGGELVEPFYKQARNRALILSSDCTQPTDYCFCTSLGYKPFPETGFDLNLTPLDDFYLLEAGSLWGEELIKENESLFKSASAEQITKREKLREEVSRSVEDLNPDLSLQISPQAAEPISLPENKVWEEYGGKCVECGVCNLVCPTCNCFLLYEGPEEEGWPRNRIWDGCSFQGYARVAGGANPLKTTQSRFRNRFYCKLSRFPENYRLIGCVGCGRCTEGCLAGIDIREVLKQTLIIHEKPV